MLECWNRMIRMIRMIRDLGTSKGERLNGP